MISTTSSVTLSSNQIQSKKPCITILNPKRINALFSAGMLDLHGSHSLGDSGDVVHTKAQTDAQDSQQAGPSSKSIKSPTKSLNPKPQTNLTFVPAADSSIEPKHTCTECGKSHLLHWPPWQDITSLFVSKIYLCHPWILQTHLPHQSLQCYRTSLCHFLPEDQWFLMVELLWI